MSYEINTIQIKTLDSITANVPNKVIDAIDTASRRSGVNFSYLVQQASAESSFNPNASSKSSSATGLYQFIDSTWLSMIDRYGDKYGIDSEGKTNKELLDMRKNPKAAAFMAAAFASENEKTLNNNWGGDVGSTELYFAHFMGANGASSFLNARDDNPMQRASDLFPKAAEANPNVFYDAKNGKPRSLEEVYQFFDNKFRVKGDDSEPRSNPITSNTELNDYKNRLALSDNIIMQRSQAMRKATKPQNNYEQIFAMNTNNSNKINNYNTQKMPFFSLITKPIDVMMLAQRSEPNKVISDKA